MNKEIIKPFLSKSIETCERCGKDKKKQEIEINMLKSELCDLQQTIKYLEEVNRKSRRKKKGKRCKNDK